MINEEYRHCNALIDSSLTHTTTCESLKKKSLNRVRKRIQKKNCLKQRQFVELHSSMIRTKSPWKYNNYNSPARHDLFRFTIFSDNFFRVNFLSFLLFLPSLHSCYFLIATMRMTMASQEKKEEKYECKPAWKWANISRCDTSATR